MKFVVRWADKVAYEEIVTAKNKAEVKKRFFDGELLRGKREIIEEDYEEDSLEIEKA